MDSTDDEKQRIESNRISFRLTPFWRRYIDSEMDRLNCSQTDVIMAGLRLLRHDQAAAAGTPLPPEVKPPRKPRRKRPVVVETVQQVETNENQA